MEFTVSEQPNSLERAPVIFASIRVRELYMRWTVGDSLVESAQLQCDFALRNLLGWFNIYVLHIRMHDFPLEVCLLLKSVDSELFDVVVEREAFRHCLRLLTINIIFWRFYLQVIEFLCQFRYFIRKLLILF